MQSITVYDIEAEKLNKVADRNDTSIAEIIAELMEYLPEIMEYNGWE